MSFAEHKYTTPQPAKRFKAKLFKSVNPVTPLNDRISHNSQGVPEKFEPVSTRRIRASFL
jgi:hypothetical protein